MSATPAGSDPPPVPDMDLQLVPVPVTDVDRAKEFYLRAGFGGLHDTQVTPEMRVVQLTPPGSGCAIVFGTGMGPITDMEPGSVKGLHLVVHDINTAREALLARGIDVGGVDAISVASCTPPSRTLTATCGCCSSGRAARPRLASP